MTDPEWLLDHLAHWQGWWTNRVSRVVLVFSNLGSRLGAFVAFGWLEDLVYPPAQTGGARGYRAAARRTSWQ